MAVSGNLNTSNDRVKYNITVTESNVNTANNSSDITISVKFWRTNTGYETYGTGTVYVTVDGTQYTQAVTSSQKITNAGIVLFNKKMTIKHNSDGSKTVNVKAKISLGSVLSSDYQGFNVTLTKISTTPSAISTFTISAGFGNYVGLGDTINLSWSKASGTVTGYELQYQRGNSGWKAFKTVTGTSTTDSFTSTNIETNGAGCAVQYRVRALNGSQASGWKVSNILYITGGMDLKVSNAWETGSVWIKVNGAWKRAKRVWIKINGTWQYSK
jgi:hypothetical protein